MSSRNLIIAIATIAVVVMAWKISQQKAPETELATDRLYPALFDQLNDANRVSIKTTEHNTELAKLNDEWVVANRDNFPAEFTAIKSTLLNIAQVSVIERKTSKPEFYEKIGVAGIEQADSNSVLVQVEDANGNELASVVIGNERDGSNLETPNYYVRKAKEAVALLVEGDLDIDDEPTDWMNTEIANIEAKRIRNVTIDRPDDKPIVASKESHNDPYLALEGIPAGFVATSRSSVSAYGGLLLNLKFEDVAAVTKVHGLEPQNVAKVQTFDGMVATVEQFNIDEDAYIRFHFAFDPDIVIAPPEVPEGIAAALDSLNKKDDPSKDNEPEEEVSVEDEVGTLNAKVSDWVYKIPEYKVRLLDKKFDELIKPEEGEKKPTEEAKDK